MSKLWSFIGILSLTFAFSFQLQAENSCDVSLAVSAIEGKILKKGLSGYDLEGEFEGLERIYLSDWPYDVHNGIFLNLWQPEYPYGVSRTSLYQFTRSFGANENYSGSLVRTYKLTLPEDSVYVVIYLVAGGREGRDQLFLEYYFVKESGEIIQRGTAK